MVATAERTGRRLIEAFHDRYHPLSAKIDEIVASGRLGKILSVHGEFLVSNPFDPASLRHDPELGGGALMDLGCYPLHWLRTLFGEPTVLAAIGSPNPLGVDMSIVAELEFAGGIRGTVAARMDHDGMTNSLTVTGEHGSLHVDDPVFPSRGHSIREVVDGVERNSTVAGWETYDHQLAAVVEAIESGKPALTEGADIVGNMIAIDSIYAASAFPRTM